MLKHIALYVAMAIALIAWAVAFNLAMPSMAGATVGISHGIGPHIGSPTTISVGRLYYNPGNGHINHHDPVAGSDAGTALDDFVHPEREYKRLKKLQCEKDHFGYVMRHGVTTPTPLKGFHGCAKYAMDAAYWRHRRNEPSLRVQTDPFAIIRQAVVLNIHDTFIH